LSPAGESSGSKPKPLIIKSPPDLDLEDGLRKIVEARCFYIVEKRRKDAMGSLEVVEYNKILNTS
jgi:hypothetical protein